MRITCTLLAFLEGIYIVAKYTICIVVGHSGVISFCPLLYGFQARQGPAGHLSGLPFLLPGLPKRTKYQSSQLFSVCQIMDILAQQGPESGIVFKSLSEINIIDHGIIHPIQVFAGPFLKPE